MPDDDTTNQPPEPANRSPRRRWLKRFLALAAVALTVVVSSPWWMPLLARFAAKQFVGVTVETLSSDGLTRWTARGIEVPIRQGKLTVAEADMPSPIGWLKAKTSGDPRGASVTVRGWTLALAPAESDQPAKPPPTLADIHAIANNALRQIDAQLGPIILENGGIRNPRGELARFDAIALHARAVETKLAFRGRSVNATIDAKDPDHWKIDLSDKSDGSSARLTLDTDTDALVANGTLLSQGNEAAIEARWPLANSRFIPSVARIQAANIDLDERYPFWQSAPPIKVDFNATWKDGSYTFAIDSPQPAANAPQSQSVHLAGSGTLDGLTIERGKVDLSWIELQMDAPVALDFSLRNPLENASLSLVLDLGRAPWIEAKGQLHARLATSSTITGAPRVSATLDGESLSVSGSQIDSFDASLTAEGRRIHISKLALIESQGSTLQASGLIDLDAQTIEYGKFEASVAKESPLAQRFAGLASWTTLSASGAVEGELRNPTVHATAKLGQIETKRTPPTDVALELSGTSENLDCTLTATNLSGILDTAFSLQPSQDALDGSIQKLEVTTLGAKALELLQPVQFHADTRNGTISVLNLFLDGPAGSRLSIPKFELTQLSLDATLSATSIAPQLAQPWIRASIPGILIQKIDATAHLSATGSTVDTSGKAIWRLNPDNAVEASWLARQGPDSGANLAIGHIQFGSQGRSILEAKGTLSLAIEWKDGTPSATLNNTNPFSFSISSIPYPDFWKSVAAVIPFAISRPTINAQLEGTLQSPKGNASVRFDSIEWASPSETNKRVTLSNVKVDLSAQQNSIEATALSARIGGNTISGAAKLPLGNETVVDILKERRLPKLSELEGDAEIHLVDFPALADWLPPFIRESGAVSLTAHFSKDSVNGVARIDGLATRPMPPLGALSKIQGEIDFSNGVWKAKSLTGVAEQSPFTLAGSVDLNTPEHPHYDLDFDSKAFPLARGDGIALTGDIDLKLLTDGNEPPTLSGEIGLTKGLVLVEPDLFANPTKTSHQYPPYFSASAEPFNEWRLNVDIEGDRFLRVSNTYFQGSLSADFQLEGTLGAPLLIGKARADSGRINFPAASLELASGEATITRERPTVIQIDANANGRLYAHDIHLIATGRLDNPKLTITTNPALTQVEALLLVTTGALPNAQTSLAKRSATSLGLFFGKGLFRKLMPQGGGDSTGRFNLVVGNDISFQGKPTVDATYQLTKSLELEGEYDKRDEYNANLKWTFYKK